MGIPASKPIGGGRYEFIDILKGFTIIWVLWMHMNLPELIYPSVQMPIFFFISGSFYHAKTATLWEQVKGDAYRLLLPTISFMAIAAVLLILRGENCWSWNIISVIQKLRNSSITWFLIALFCFRALNYPLRQNKGKLWLLVMAVIVYPIGFFWKVRFPELVIPVIPLTEMFMFGIYYVIGFCVGPQIIQHSITRHKGLINPVACLCLVYSFPYTVACIYLGLMSCRMLENIGIVANLLSYVGKNSIVFYLTHWPLWIFLFKPLSWNLYVVFLTITVWEFPLIYVITHYFPWMIGQKQNFRT